MVASGGGDGAWTFSLVRARNSFNLDAIKQAMELGDPLGEIKRRDYYLTKDNALFQAVGNFFATRLKDMGWKLEPPPGLRELTVCLLDSKTLAVADRAQMEKFLNADAQPEYRSKLTTGPAAGEGDAGGGGGGMSPGPGGRMYPGPGMSPAPVGRAAPSGRA